jgi:hypothetical protein
MTIFRPAKMRPFSWPKHPSRGYLSIQAPLSDIKSRANSARNSFSKLTSPPIVDFHQTPGKFWISNEPRHQKSGLFLLRKSLLPQNSYDLIFISEKRLSFSFVPVLRSQTHLPPYSMHPGSSYRKMGNFFRAIRPKLILKLRRQLPHDISMSCRCFNRAEMSKRTLSNSPI